MRLVMFFLAKFSYCINKVCLLKKQISNELHCETFDFGLVFWLEYQTKIVIIDNAKCATLTTQRLH